MLEACLRHDAQSRDPGDLLLWVPDIRLREFRDDSDVGHLS